MAPIIPRSIHRTRRYLTLLAVMLPVVLFCGWLMMAGVQCSTNAFISAPRVERGWPWGFQSLSAHWPTVFEGLSKGTVQIGFLAADLAVMAAMVIAAAFVLAGHRRRRGSWFRFSLRSLLLLTAACAVPLASWTAVNPGWQREQELVARFDRYPLPRPIVWTYCGPAWLRRFVPWEGQQVFERRTTFNVDWDAHENAAVELPAAIDQLRFVTKLVISADSPVRVADAAQLSLIENLEISGAGVDDEAMQWIVQLPGLKTLYILSDKSGPCTVSDRGFALLANCRELSEILCSQRVNISADAIGQLAALADLHSLELTDTPITPEVLAAIAKLQHLTKLELMKCSFSDSAMLGTLTKLPHLESLWIEKLNATDAELLALSKCRTLKFLFLAECPNISDEGICNFADSAQLEHLCFGKKPHFQDKTWRLLQQRIGDVQAWSN